MKLRVILLSTLLMFTSLSGWAQKAIDLGLSVKWADMNVGAEKPTDSGDYFTWGDPSGMLAPEQVFSSEYEVGDIVGTKRDIAAVIMGAGWRMPTSNELRELYEKCDWSAEMRSGVKGFRVTGPNGNSIFLPVYGAYIRGEYLEDEGCGLWSGSFNDKYSRIDFILLWIRDDGSVKIDVRQANMSAKFNVRAVHR